MNDGQRMSCQHQQRLGDKRKKMRGYKKIFFRREMSLLWLTAQRAVEWIVQVTMLCLQSVTLCGLLKQEWIQLPGRCHTNSKESFAFFFLNRSSVQPLINIALFSHPSLICNIFSFFYFTILYHNYSAATKTYYTATHTLNFSLLHIWGSRLTEWTLTSLS